MYKHVEALNKKSRIRETLTLSKCADSSTDTILIFTASITLHLCFKHAQPKMFHSPKVENRVDNLFFSSVIHIFGHLF